MFYIALVFIFILWSRFLRGTITSEKKYYVNWWDIYNGRSHKLQYNLNLRSSNDIYTRNFLDKKLHGPFTILSLQHRRMICNQRMYYSNLIVDLPRSVLLVFFITRRFLKQYRTFSNLCVIVVILYIILKFIGN